MKRSICLFFSALTVSITQAASAPDQNTQHYSALQKDVKILTRIFETTLSSEQKNSAGSWLHHSNVEGLYLAHQGILFSVDLPGNPARHWLGFNAAPLAPLAPLAPVSVAAPVVAVDIDIEDDIDDEELGLGDIEEYVESVIESTMQGTELALQSHTASKAERDALRAKLRELQKAQQAHEKQVEAMQEQIEALEEKSSSNDKAARAKAKESLEKSRQALRQSRDSYRQTINTFRAEQGKRWQQQVVTMQDEILDTLCNYASSVRRLPDDEHVTFLFRHVGTKEQGEHQVFVIKRADIMSCVTTPQAAGFLRKRVTVYNT